MILKRERADTWRCAVNTFLPPGATVPIGWVAVGNPAQSAWFAAHRRDRILDEGPPQGDG